MIEVVITSSVLIAALLLLRRLLRGRINPRLQYALWLLAALRLLIPFSVPAPTSIMNTSGAAVVQQVITKTASVAAPEGPVSPDMVSAPAAPSGISSAGEQAAQINWLKIIWVGGAALTGIYFAAANLLFSIRLKRSSTPLDITECRLPVRIAEDLPSPCLFGLFRPTIYLTPQAANDPEMLRHVITHEYCHYRQGDHFWSLIRILCLIFHWFNPLLWAAAFCSRTDCELSCDRLVIRNIDQDERIAYGQTLVTLVQQRQKFSHIACTATTMTANSSKTRERVTAILKSPGTAIPVLLAVLACASLLIGITFTGSEKNALPDDAEVAQLLQKGEAVYQMGNTEILSVSQYEIRIGDLYYDEIENYDQAVANLFTPQGILQLEETCCLNIKLIQKQEDKIYRASAMTDSAVTVFFDNISSIELIEQQENRFTYKVTHTSRPIRDEGREFTSRMVLMREDGRLLIESFDYPLRDGQTADVQLPEEEASSVPQHAESRIPLDKDNAPLTIARILETLILDEDGTLHFTIPSELPVTTEQVDLYATLNLTYDSSGTFRVDSPLDWTTGWQPGQVYSTDWTPGPDEQLTEVMLRMAYMIDLGEGQYREFAADYVKLTVPLPFGQSAAPTGTQLTMDNNRAGLTFTSSNGQVTHIDMTLPHGITLEKADDNHPVFSVIRDGKHIGNVTLYDYGTSDRQTLMDVKTNSETLPMQIYSPIVLSNHMDFSSGYRVVDFTDSASRAVCRMQYHDLSEYDGPAVEAPWLETDCILSYDLDDNPIFAAIILDPDVISSTELEQWAAGIHFNS